MDNIRSNLCISAGVNALTTPHYWWVLWVMAGWGLGLILDLIFHLTKLSDDDDAE